MNDNLDEWTDVSVEVQVGKGMISGYRGSNRLCNVTDDLTSGGITTQNFSGFGLTISVLNIEREKYRREKLGELIDCSKQVQSSEIFH